MAGTTKSNAGAPSESDESQDFSRDKAAIEEQLVRIRADMSELAATLGAIGARRAKSARGEAEDRLNDLTRAGEDALDELRMQLRSVERELMHKTEEKPLQTLGIAAGVGFLVGLILRR